MLRAWWLVVFITGAELALLAIFQARFIYFPEHTPEGTIRAFLTAGGQRLDFRTSQGRQTAWLRPAKRAQPAERLWIVCAGNGSQALDMESLQADSGLADDAFLMVDYPGYGVSEGTPNPATIEENLRGAVPLACAACGIPVADLPARGQVFGHSLGCAAALLAAEHFGIKRAVLLAPFVSTMEMTKVMLHVPLGWLLTHRFDNRARLAALRTRGGHVWIFHGAEDQTIPVRMGRTLSSELGSAATFREVPGANHDYLLDLAHTEIYHAMREARD